MISYAQNCEDVLLNRLFPAGHKGFYIDVGACHPTNFSVTAHFYSQGWSGINIEPSYSFRNFERERPRDVNLQVAISNACGSAEFHEFPGVLGISSINQELAEHAVAELGYRYTTRKVSVMTLAEVCRAHVRGPIDFLSIDVEGHEREVLEGADFAKYRPRALVIEATRPHCSAPVHDGWEHLLLSADYLFAFFDGLNRYYVRAEDRDLISRLAVPANVFDDFVSQSLYDSMTEAQSLKLRLDTLEELQPISAALARRFNRLERRLPQLSNLLVRWRQRFATHASAR
jgi:FkbM family methyltransferase